MSFRSSQKMYLIITGIFLLSRIILFAIGVRFILAIELMSFLDPILLTERWAETIFYTHAHPPLTNAFLGIGLKLAGEHADSLFHFFFVLFGLGLTLSLAYLLRLVGLGKTSTIVLSSIFCLSPPSIYFENFYLYTYPNAALLAALAIVFFSAIKDATFRRWFLFFSLCAFICYLRSTFHFVWLLAMLTLALIFAGKAWKNILKAFALPSSLVLLLYLKNFLVFGFFGASSWFGASFARQTVYKLSEADRQEWVKEKHISPIVHSSIFSPPKQFPNLLAHKDSTGIPCLDQEMNSTGIINFNHWIYIKLSKLQQKGCVYYVKERPFDYLKSVSLSFVLFFTESTRWHAHDKEKSPFIPNRKLLEPLENTWNTTWHSFPIKYFGLYSFFIALILPLMGIIIFRLFKNNFQGMYVEKLILFMLLNVAYVAVISSLFQPNELARYRYQLEVYIWVIMTFSLLRLPQAIKGISKGK